MQPETITVTRNGPALILTFNRPDKRNALSQQLLKELTAALQACDTDPQVRGVILTGGPQIFSAGADLNEALKASTPKAVMAFLDTFHTLANVMQSLSKPIIAAIEGFCITGGLELALACDLRVGAKGSSYAITSSRIGTVAGFGGTQRLPRLVGPANALQILFGAESIAAEEAYRIGLLNRLTEKGKALDQALSLVKLYETRAPLSLALVKRAVYEGLDMSLPAAIQFEKVLVSAIYATQDKREGISAFLDKRPANFKGE